MIVVYGVQIVVFIMPAERTELHTHVQPGHVHSVDRRLVGLCVYAMRLINRYCKHLEVRFECI